MFSQNRRFPRRTVLDCTVSSPTKANVTSSGTAGMERHPGTSVRLVWPTTGKLESVCGPIKFLNVKTKVKSKMILS